MAQKLCGYCGQPSFSWQLIGKGWKRVEYKPAEDVKSFLCGGCVQLFLGMPIEKKLELWRELHEAEDQRIHWLERFIDERMLRHERRKSECGELHIGRRPTGLAGDKEGHFKRPEIKTPVSIRKADPAVPAVLPPRRHKLAPRK